MEVVSTCPLRVAAYHWQPRAGMWALSLACKATYRLVPGVCELAQQQDDPVDADNYWNDDPSRSLYAPSDLVPFKVRADVLLVGHAFAARGEPTRSLVARLIVGEVDKSVEVWCDRSWTLEGQLREGARFARMPLLYERAGGGPDTANPVGMRPDAADAYGSVAIPNLQPPGMHLTRRGEHLPAIGFGPIAPTWPSRLEKLHHHATAFLQAGGRLGQPLPEGIDLRFFNAAPGDQQLDELRPDARLVLELLHPQHPRLVTSLPGTTPRAALERPGAPPEEVRLACDTLWIDTDRGTCSLVWRGQVSLDRPNVPGRIVVSLDSATTSRAWMAPAALPDRTRDDAMLDSDTTYEPNLAESTVLPFAPAGAPRPGALQPPRPGVPQPPRPGGPPGSPWSGAPAPKPAIHRTPVPPAVPAPPVAIPAPPPVPAPPASIPASIPTSAPIPAPIPAPVPALVTTPQPRTIGEAAMTGAVGPGGAAPILERTAEPVPAPRPATPAAPVRPAGREAVTLLWLDTGKADLILAEPRWTNLQSNTPVKPKATDSDDDDDIPPLPDDDDDLFDEEEEGAETQEVQQRRLVQRILAKGQPTGGAGIEAALHEAIRPDGTLEPPLALVSGELAFPFDPWEALQATIAASAPHASDKRVKEALDSVAEVMKTPNVQRAPGVADALSLRVRDAVAQTQSQPPVQPGKPTPPSQLDAQVERMLLEQRAYQKRTVLGQTWIRSLLHAQGASDPIPVYLPEALSKELPLSPRMRARVVAEVHPQQDPYEGSPTALKPLAVARLVTVGAPRK